MSEWETTSKDDGWENVAPQRRSTDTVVAEKPYGSPLASVAEPVLNMATGMIAKPVSDAAGLAGFGMEVARRAGLPLQERDPMAIQRGVQNALTYAPRTQVGEAVTEYNPLALIGKGINWLGQQAESGVNAIPGMNIPFQNALASTAHEAVNQAPMFLGLGVPAAAAGTKSAMMGAQGGGAGMFTARGMMQSAMKPSAEDLLTGKAGKAIDFMLEKGLNESKGGVETMRDRVFNLNNEIKQKIASSPAVISQPGLMAQVNQQMNQVLGKFYNQALYSTDIAAIQKAWNEVANHPLLQGPDIPVQRAQNIKQGTYKSLGEKAYPGGNTSGGAAAEKEIARIMKEEVANAVPEVRALNAEESRYLNALNVVERRALTEANKNLIGMGWLTTNPIHMAMWMADRSALFKSLVARMIAGGSRAIPEMNIAGPVSGAAVTQQADQQRLSQ